MAQDELLSEMVLAISSSVRCGSCGVEEYVFPLDDEPIDMVFAANYLCYGCEEVVINMQAAAQSKFYPVSSSSLDRKKNS